MQINVDMPLPENRSLKLKNKSNAWNERDRVSLVLFIYQQKVVSFTGAGSLWFAELGALYVGGGGGQKTGFSLKKEHLFIFRTKKLIPLHNTISR
jgi:hypothetical protein